MKTFDPTKPVQTRDGLAARILCADLATRLGWSIVAASKDKSGDETTFYTYPDGRLLRYRETQRDLVNIPVRTTLTKFVKTRKDKALIYITETPVIHNEKLWQVSGFLAFEFEDGELMSVTFNKKAK